MTSIPMNQPLGVKFLLDRPNGRRVKVPGTIVVTPSAIEFVKSPFELKDEIKAMRGAKWHGFEDPPRKIWTISNCDRNWFQLRLLLGENPYSWFDRELVHYAYDRPLMSHQRNLSDSGLTYHFQIWAAEMGTGKTLSAIEVLEKSKLATWWWVGPKSGLFAIEREFKKWEVSSSLNIEIMTYEGLVKRMKEWTPGAKAPMGVIFDESSRLKTPRTQRTQAAQQLADGIRADHGLDGYVILMSGTPSPKSPLDWWTQAEICYPGFLREGDFEAFKYRLGIWKKQEVGGVAFPQRVAWKDDPARCNICGEYEDAPQHGSEMTFDCEEDAIAAGFHDYEPSKNEVGYLSERLKGLVIVQMKADCLDLPDKRFRIVRCEPHPATLRAAAALVKAAPNTITGLTWLRELSDGFQYRSKPVGMTTCPTCDGKKLVDYWVDPNDPDRAFTIVDMMDPEYVATLEKQSWTCASCGGEGEIVAYERQVKEVPCPKEGALLDLLDENEETGRIVIFAGFTGSVDRVTRMCLKHGWDVVQVDGRGWVVYTKDGQKTHDKPLDYWANRDNQYVAFVAHPKSGGMALTLTEARMAVFYSNDYNPESRHQACDRIHRIGMDLNKGATIVDLIHLPTDERVLNILQDNRRLELMSLGELAEDLGDPPTDEEMANVECA
ncbi:MAG: hypothetical protein AMXMBFR16_10580 [Candidatus Uhrbacteria bacterium]